MALQFLLWQDGGGIDASYDEARLYERYRMGAGMIDDANGFRVGLYLK